MSALTGYRTYILAAVAVIVTGLHGTGYLADGTFNTVMAILGSLGFVTLHAAIKP